MWTSWHLLICLCHQLHLKQNTYPIYLQAALNLR
nr:MAG TPA: hypothetical protein [Caudoviricetes sp.]